MNTNNNNNHTVASSNKHHPKNNNKTMEQDLFEFFDSLSQPSPVGEWFTTPSHQPLPSSAHSSPEIATPLDIHLSPPVKVENIPASRVQATSLIGATGSTATNMNGGDLDMSEILNSPLFDSPSSTPAMTPAMPQVDMFSELHQDLPSALAAFVAAVSSVTSNNTNNNSSSNTSTPIIPTLPLNVNMNNSNVSSPSSSSSSSNINNNNNRKRSHSSSNDDNITLTADEAAIKRQKNTDAARRSRLKKVMKMESLEKRVNELERMNAQLLLRVAVLDSEKSHLQTKEATHEARIKTLENQLAEAHKALASRS